MKKYTKVGLPFEVLGINTEIFQKINTKFQKMKKVLAIALIAGAMVACNNSGDKKTDNKDTMTKTGDTTIVPPNSDTTVVVDTTHM